MTNKEFLISCCGVDKKQESKAMVNVSCLMVYEGGIPKVIEDITLTEPVVNIVRMYNDTFFDLTFKKNSHEFLQLIGMLCRFLKAENFSDDKCKGIPCIAVTLCPKGSDITDQVTMIGANPTYFASGSLNFIDSIKFSAPNNCVEFLKADENKLDLQNAENEAIEELIREMY